MRRSFAISFISTLCSFVFVTAAHAQWPQGLVVQTGTSGTQFGLVDGQIMAGSGPTDFFALYGTRGSGGTIWKIQHLTTGGGLLWNAADTYLQNSDNLSSREYGPQFVPTASGFLNPFWRYDGVARKSALYVGFGDANGAISPASAPYGVRITDLISSSTQRPVASCRRENGGAWLGWSASNRFCLLPWRGDQTIEPGWPVNGGRLPAAIVPNVLTMPTMEPDGTGLLIAFTNTSFAPRVVRVSSDTTLSPGWPASGLALSDSLITFFAPIHLVRSDATHWFAIWVADSQIVVRRFGVDGQFDPAWPAAGVRFVRHGSPLNLKTFSDGASGVTIGWVETEAFAMTHVLADGSSPGLYATGPRVTVSPHNFSDNYTHVGICRGVGDGAIVIYSKSNVFGTNAIWIDGQGWSPNRAPGDTLASVPLSSNFGCALAAEPDGWGGAYYLLFGATAQYSWLHQASHVDYLGIPTTGVTPSPRAADLALSLGPNPARDALTARFTLPSGAPARIELLDLAGRRIASRDVHGAGAHAETFEGLSRLAPGLYLARVTSPEGAHGARFVLTR